MGKLLIVDDDAAVRRLMRIELGQNYEVFDSGEPEKGLALALEHKPDAILLDLRMPHYSGYELLQTYTSLSHTQGIPVVIVSGEAGAQTKEHCSQLGAAGYFEKPIDFEALRACLKKIARARPRVSPADVQVRLRVPLKLTTDGAREAKIVTESVSMNSFECRSPIEFQLGLLARVYLSDCGEKYAGKAQVVLAGEDKEGCWKYRFSFIERTGVWVLQ